MVEEGYDLVIRVNPDPDESLVGRIFLRDGLVIVASPTVARPAKGAGVPVVVRGSPDQARTWIMTTAAGRSEISVDPVLGLSSLTMVRDAVRMGLGAARLPVSLVSRDLAAGRLVQWGDVDGPETRLWALYPSRRLLSARVSAFLDYLKDAFPTGAPEELAAYVAD
jgi:DNA-binding transcriptional LysR family regulator